MNDVPCGLVPYIDWLISRDERERDRSKMGKPLEYTNRRRLTHYSIMTDSAKVVGYSVKNPITGYNYAYRYRFNPRFAKVMDGVLENAWVVGLSTTLIGSAFIWRSRDSVDRSLRLVLEQRPRLGKAVQNGAGHIEPHALR